MSKLMKTHFLKMLFKAAVVTIAVAPARGHACRMYVPPNLGDVHYADVVVIGRVANFRIIRDEAFRKRMLAAPRLSQYMREFYSDPKKSILSDYARFDINVDQVLVGQASAKLSVTWDNSTFGEPDHIAPKTYVIALRRPGSPAPPLRGPSATISPSPDPDALTLLQAPCSGAFIYEAESEEGRTILQMFGER